MRRYISVASRQDINKVHKWVQMHYLFKQCGAGRENDETSRINTCVTRGAALRQVYDRASKSINCVCNLCLYISICVYKLKLHVILPSNNKGRFFIYLLN